MCKEKEIGFKEIEFERFWLQCVGAWQRLARELFRTGPEGVRYISETSLDRTRIEIIGSRFGFIWRLTENYLAAMCQGLAR